MKLERIGKNNVIVPENELDREILQCLLVHMKPDDAGDYWDVTTNSFDPMDQEDQQGRMYVSWEKRDGERQLDPFSICKNEGHLVVEKMPMPSRR